MFHPHTRVCSLVIYLTMSLYKSSYCHSSSHSFVIYSGLCLCICSPLLPCLISPLSHIPLPFMLYSDHCLYICSHYYRLVSAPSYCRCSLLFISCLASPIQVPRRTWGPTISQAQAGTAIALTISSSSSSCCCCGGGSSSSSRGSSGGSSNM